MHYEKEWEKQYGQYDNTVEAYEARAKLEEQLSPEDKVDIMFGHFLRFMGHIEILEMAEKYCDKEENTVEGSN